MPKSGPWPGQAGLGTSMCSMCAVCPFQAMHLCGVGLGTLWALAEESTCSTTKLTFSVMALPRCVGIAIATMVSI